MHFARSLWGCSSKLPVVISSSRGEDAGVSSISCWNSWQCSSSFWCWWAFKGGGKQLEAASGALWNNLSKVHRWFGLVKHWKVAGRGKNTNIANNFIAFALKLLFSDEMRSVLQPLSQGVLLLYRKAPRRESSLASQGLSPKCACPSAYGRNESALRRRWRW